MSQRVSSHPVHFSRQFEVEASRLLSDKFAQHLKDDENISLEVSCSDGFLSLKSLIGTQERAHEFEFKMPSEDDDLEESSHLLLDFLDGVLEEFFRNQREGGFPLDFSKRQFEGVTILVRQEYRNFLAEQLADEFLKAHQEK